MELAGPVIQLFEWISAPISGRWNHYKGLHENWDTLKERMEELDSRKRDILSRLDTELVQGETKLKDEVRLWLQRAEKTDAEINMISQKVETVKCFSRAGIGKSVIQKIEEVRELHRSGEFCDGLVIQLPQHFDQEILPTPTLGCQTTFKRKMEEIWACLTGDEVRKIGVYGMGGIGKTTVMKHIYNRLLRNKEKFDGVIWVTVSKASSITKLQDAIASQINFDILKFDDGTTRVSKLYAELSRKRRYVLILDDLWHACRLDEVGIPEPTPQNGIKLVLTTRLLNVCLGMSCKPIPMERLSETEALNLFLDTVGRDVLSIPNMEQIVNSVVKECACLPLAIITIAGSLKGIVDYNDWKTTLEDLKASTNGTNEIFEKLKVSYDRLNDKNLQACLLYCALFPEDYAIERGELIEYLIAEEIIMGRNRQVRLERGHAMLNKLIYACLLEVDHIGRREIKRGDNNVKMHDLIRDMAIQITSDNPRFLVEAGTGLRCLPNEENWKEDLTKVSLMNNAISEIPSSFESPKCPTLSTLLLNGNINLSSISNNFFMHMKGLSLLDLSETPIKNLPESLSELVNLTVLLLKRCHKLSHIPSLAKLTALKRLDFYESGVKKVPQGMENLVRLRYLELDQCELEVFPDGLLCKLIELRFLSLNRDCIGAEIRGEELVYLRKLEDLYCVLYDMASFNAYVRSLTQGGPTHYILQLGSTGGGSCWRADHKRSKAVCLKNCDISESVATGGDCPLLLPQDVEILDMDTCLIKVSSLSELTSFENGVMNLRWCSIRNCDELEHLFVYSSSVVPLVQRLEKLELHSLTNLQGLIKEEGVAPSLLPPGTFSSLKILRVWNCDNVKRLFINAPLQNLVELTVHQCKQLVEIMSTTHDDDEEDQDHEEAGGSDHQAINTVTLPKLSNLELSCLPKLKSIPVVAGHSLFAVSIQKCPKLKRVPCIDREPCPPVKRVDIDDDLWESLEWDHSSAKVAIQSTKVNNIMRYGWMDSKVSDNREG